MLRPIDRTIKLCAVSFTLLSLFFISTTVMFSQKNSSNISHSIWSASTLSETERHTATAALTTALFAIIFSLQFLAMRLKETKKLLKRSNLKIERLAKSNQHINKKLEVSAVMRALVESAIELTESTDGAAGLIKNGQMVFTEYYKNGEWIPINFSFPPGYGVPGWVIKNKSPYLSNDAENDFQVIQEIREQLGFYNLIDTPILNAEGELIGCFEIHNTKNRRPFDDQDILALMSLSASAAIAIENSDGIAAQNKAKELLFESEQKFRSLFENSPISLWEEDFSEVKSFIDEVRRQGISDLDDFFKTNHEAAIRCAKMVKVIDVNQNTVKLFSARSKDDLTSHLDQLFCARSLDPFIQGVIKMTQNKSDCRVIGINKTLNGEELEFKIQASIMPGYEDTWGKVIVSMSDITHEREIDRMKNEFISTAAHELRTPLAVIMGYSDLMLDHLEKDEYTIKQKKEFLLNINSKVDALERIVEDLLDVSKIESGRSILLEKSLTKLSTLVGNLAHYHQRETDKHHIKIFFDNPNLTLMVDTGRITQVLDNLISNAVKYSPEGGEIEITCSRDKEEIEIRVQDHGLGMTEDQRDRIFDKFYRADTSNTAISGLGLGMSIAKSIVEAHGGNIWVDSVPGEGTTVRFTLPVQTPSNSYFNQEISGNNQIH
jgi:signal transduction histidine kinase